METENSQEKLRVRRRFTAEEKQRHVLEQSRSGLSVSGYCKQQGISYGNLLRWRRQADTPVSDLRPMELVGGSSHPELIAEIRFSGGETLLIHSGCTDLMAKTLAGILA